MMTLTRIAALSLLIVLINSTVFGQEFAKAEILKHRIKTVTMLDEKGLVKKVNHYNESGELVSTGVKEVAGLVRSKELIYDEHRLLVEEKNYNPLGDIHFTHRFAYNGLKQLIRKESINGENTVVTTWAYEYDNDGNLIRESQKSTLDGNNYTTYKYRKGKLVEEETTNEVLGKEEKITFTYDERGLITEQKIRSYFTNSTTTIKFIYNSNGKLIRQVDSTDKGEDGETTYNYDEKGLLSRQTVRSNADNLIQITTFNYEFF